MDICYLIVFSTNIILHVEILSVAASSIRGLENINYLFFISSLLALEAFAEELESAS